MSILHEEAGKGSPENVRELIGMGADVNTADDDGTDKGMMDDYRSRINSIANLQLLSDSQNKSKNAKTFAEWFDGFPTERKESLREAKLYPQNMDYDFSHFIEFTDKRRELLKERLAEILGVRLKLNGNEIDPEDNA